MRFSPEGIPGCGADVAIWSTGVVDTEKKTITGTGEANYKALVSCEGCPLDMLELPNKNLNRVSGLQLQEFFEENCPQRTADNLVRFPITQDLPQDQ